MTALLGKAFCFPDHCQEEMQATHVLHGRKLHHQLLLDLLLKLVLQQ